MAQAAIPVRPADTAAAVRDVFSTSRMQGAWGLLSSSAPGDRQAAIEGVSRLLEREGLGLADIMTAILERPATSIRPSASGAPMSAFGDIFESFFKADAQARAKSPPTPAPAPRKPILQGAEIPARIHGTIKVLDERKTRKGAMLVFSVEASDAVHSCINCFDDAGIERLKQAAASGAGVHMTIRQPNDARYSPTARLA